MYIIFPLITIIEFLVYAVILGGYLGKIYQASENIEIEPFLSLSHKYFKEFLFFKIFWLILISPALLFLVPTVRNPMFAVSFLIYTISLLILGYFLYLTPFIIVADNLPFLEALKKSIMLANSRSEVLLYAISFLFLTGIMSILIYLLMNIPILGFITCLIITSYVGSVFTAATMSFYTYMKKL